MKMLKQTNKNKHKKMIDTSTLTEREKNLLFLLAVVLILVGGFKYILSPLELKTSELKLSRDNLQMQEVDARASIETLDATKAENKRLKLEVEKKSEEVSKFLNDENVDSLITGICIENGLKPVALSIESEPYKKVDIDNSPKSEAGSESEEASTPTEDTEVTEDASQEEVNAELEDEVPSYMRTATVSMVMTGSKDNMLNFIDSINKKEYLLVDEFSSSFEDQITHTVKIKINMINADIK